MSSAIHGRFLEVTAVSCSKLKRVQLIGWQDPYLCIEYANTKFRTRTCTDGGKNPTFKYEKFQIPLIEGLHEMNIVVWNSKTITADTFIGASSVQLNKVVLEGYDDNPWMLMTRSGKYAGEAKQIMHFAYPRNQQNPAMPGYMHAPPTPGDYGPYLNDRYTTTQPSMHPATGYPQHPMHQQYGPQQNRPEVYDPQAHMHHHPPHQGQSYYPPGNTKRSLNSGYQQLPNL